MTAIQIIPLVILVVMFVVATKWPLNIGVMGLVASFGVGYFMLGMTDKEILADFPANIVITIIGVTYFFSMAQRNGTIDIIVQNCVRLVRGKTLLLPWVFFLLAASLTALGTFSPAAVALLAPAAIGLAYESRIHPVLMGAFIINGAHAGGFSPLSVAGVLVHDIAVKNGFPISQGALFGASFALNLILSVLTVVLFALLGKLRDGAAGQHAELERPAPPGRTASRSSPWRLIVAMLVCALGFHMPIGFVALSAGLLLALVNIKEHQTFIGGVSWSTVLLVAGMITYVSLLQHVGVIDTLAEQALALGAPLLIALVLCYVIGVGSAFASSTALLTAFIPLGRSLAGNQLTECIGNSCGPRHRRHGGGRIAVLHRWCPGGGQRPRKRPSARLQAADDVRRRSSPGGTGTGLGTAGSYRHHVAPRSKRTPTNTFGTRKEPLQHTIATGSPTDGRRGATHRSKGRTTHQWSCPCSLSRCLAVHCVASNRGC